MSDTPSPYQTHFPDFVLDSDIEIPHGFMDTSSPEFACPHWTDSNRGLILAIGYPDRPMYRHPNLQGGESKRFALLDENWKVTMSGVFSDNYEEIMAVLENEGDAFDAFQQSRRRVTSIGNTLGLPALERASGYVYLDRYWIEQNDKQSIVCIGEHILSSEHISELEIALWNLRVRYEVFSWNPSTSQALQPAAANISHWLSQSEYGSRNKRKCTARNDFLRQELRLLNQDIYSRALAL